MESRIQTLNNQGDDLFNKRLGLMSLWQEVADNFYPERADFTASRNIGRDFAANLTTSYPLLARRELGNTFSAMLRPEELDWFSITVNRKERLDSAGQQWLEAAAKKQKEAMYDRLANFERATKEGDHDFAAFGQCVLSVEVNHAAGIKRDMQALLFRCWHLRDVVWSEGSDGMVCEVHRKWKPQIGVLNHIFKGKISPQAKKLLEKSPHETIDVRHVMKHAQDYETPTDKRWNKPYVSIFYEVATGHILEEINTSNPYYIIPRWQTVSGSQYSYSPATVAALPDARLIQSMTLTLLEAGEKAVNPPLIGVQEMIRSDIQMFPGGFTAVDAEYDERLGEVLRPMTIDSRGIPIGMDMRQDVKQMITEAFYLNKISLPPYDGRDMTAYEVGQRVQEYIRHARPLFGPMETEYNGALCDATFDLLLNAGVFGSFDEIPDSIKGQDIKFRFESPLHQAVEKQKVQTFQETAAILAQAATLDPLAPYMLKGRVALRETLSGNKTPASWLRDDDQMDAIEQKHNEQQQAQNMIALMQQGGAAAEQIGKGAQAINPAMQGAV